MKIPTLTCLRRSSLEPTTFNQWLQEDENVYISTNLKKYSNDPASVREAIWGLSWLDYQLFMNEITREQYLEEYENYIRKHRWGDLHLLSGKNMGCWCENAHDCHGKVLQKLFKEQLLEKRMTQKEEGN